MDNKQKENIKKNILEKIKSVKEDIAAFKKLTKPISPDNAIGRITRMEAINSKSINEAALNKCKNTLLKLERAVTKVDNPDFGFCEECDEPIPFARLNILPETDLCVSCAEKIGL